MGDVHDFCIRVLGPGDGAAEAAREAIAEVAQEVIAEPGGDRLALLAAAARACRARSDSSLSVAPGERKGLAGAVARELAIATVGLPERQREALALRESLRLSHDEIAWVMGIEATAVAPLLARARLRLRAERRGTAPDAAGECPVRERAMRVIARRQDSEAIAAEEHSWLLEHLGSCPRCSRDHAAMLEASACYRAWRLAPAEHRSTPDGISSAP